MSDLRKRPPQVVRALWQCGLARSDDLPALGVALLAGGYETPELLALVALHGEPPSPRAAEAAAERALASLGIPPLDDAAKARWGAALVALMAIERHMGAADALRRFDHLAADLGHPKESEELMDLVWMEHEWADSADAGGRGRSRAELEALVPDVCGALLETTGLRDLSADPLSVRLLAIIRPRGNR